MAEPRSTRSRRNTPQSPTMSRNITSNAPTQNRRSTRSQSRDTVDNGGIGSQRKRNGRRNAREVSVDSLVSEGENNARHSAKDKSVQGPQFDIAWL